MPESPEDKLLTMARREGGAPVNERREWTWLAIVFIAIALLALCTTWDLHSKESLKTAAYLLILVAYFTAEFAHRRFRRNALSLIRRLAMQRAEQDT